VVRLEDLRSGCGACERRFLRDEVGRVKELSTRQESVQRAGKNPFLPLKFYEIISAMADDAAAGKNVAWFYHCFPGITRIACEQSPDGFPFHPLICRCGGVDSDTHPYCLGCRV
jgi:hypothetical protein